MLKYEETNWKNEKGLHTRSYKVTFDKVESQSTIQEQKERAERLSLVKLFESDHFIEICSRFQKNDEHFYFDKNKRFHTTLLGFPVIESANYELVREKIKQYSEKLEARLEVKFDLIRLGTKYENGNSLRPVEGVSNGTIISIGDNLRNRGFIDYGNKLASFLLKDENLNSILGEKFRRRFPSVWCTMGHYTRDFKITVELEKLFNEYKNLDSAYFHISCSELELGKSSYKDLRDWKLIEKLSVKHKTK